MQILPLILLLAMLLIDGLAKNMLVELCHRWDKHLEHELRNEIPKVREAVLILIAANSGYDRKIIERSKSGMSIEDILEDFRVGTEKSKK